MRISGNKKINNEVDFMAKVEELQDEYGEIYWNTIDGELFIHRPIGRKEYRELIKSDLPSIEKEDVVCKACILYPEDIDLDNYPAGIPSQIFKYILENSFLDSLDNKKLVMAYYRKEMEEFDNQITCIINEAFPSYDIEEIENWNMSKTAKFLSRAEWKLNVLRQVPLDFEMADQLLENEWQVQHTKLEDDKDEADNEYNESTEEIKVEPKKDKPISSFVEGETLEERQLRLSKNDGTPRKKSQEEIARLKAAFPEIDWSNEVDPNKDISKMYDSVDVTSPALRTY